MTALKTPGFLEMADINLVPYGNAHETAGADGQWTFNCQHGVVECQWNLLEACVLDYNQGGYKNPVVSFHFIACIEKNDTSSNY